ncbi:MAG TPA: hypothetical protein VHM67_05710, partial [Gemmatimonadaceae bacterium]|nr:hypothetical protein [Gemmatimonadaceae bacterium]
MRAPDRLHLRPVLVGAVVALAYAACADPIAPPDDPARPETALGGATPVAGAATLEWQQVTRDLVIASRLNPITAGRAYALVGMAQYAGVVAADRWADASAGGAGGDGGFVEPGGRAGYEARRGAIAGASATILGYLFPTAAAALEQRLVDDGNAGPGRTHPQFTRGVETGRAMGARVVSWGRTDGFTVAWTDPPWNGLPFPDPLHGGWTGVAGPPAGFQFPTMRPWYMTAPRQFRPGPPPSRYPTNSPEFTAELEAVRKAQRERTADSVALANFWNLNVGTITTLGYWNVLASKYASEHALGERDASHLFALMNSAGLDAIIGCWDTKYHYLQLRPTQADATITIVPGVPGFPFPLPNHPAYPSG